MALKICRTLSQIIIGGGAILSTIQRPSSLKIECDVKKESISPQVFSKEEKKLKLSLSNGPEKCESSPCELSRLTQWHNFRTTNRRGFHKEIVSKSTLFLLSFTEVRFRILEAWVSHRFWRHLERMFPVFLRNLAECLEEVARVFISLEHNLKHFPK